MARNNLTPAMIAAFTATHMRPAIFLDATFRSGTVYLWTGLGSITFNGNTYSGIGTFGGISVIEEGADVTARGITLTTSGFDPTFLGLVKDEFQLGTPVVVRLGCFDATPALIADPAVCWAGQMDQPQVDVSGTSAVISISCENRLIDMNVPAFFRYSNDQQQLDHPGDTGLSFVNSITEVTVVWGSNPSSFNNR